MSDQEMKKAKPFEYDIEYAYEELKDGKLRIYSDENGKFLAEYFDAQDGNILTQESLNPVTGEVEGLCKSFEMVNGSSSLETAFFIKDGKYSGRFFRFKGTTMMKARTYHEDGSVTEDPIAYEENYQEMLTKQTVQKIAAPTLNCGE